MVKKICTLMLIVSSTLFCASSSSSSWKKVSVTPLMRLEKAIKKNDTTKLAPLLRNETILDALMLAAEHHKYDCIKIILNHEAAHRVSEKGLGRALEKAQNSSPRTSSCDKENTVTHLALVRDLKQQQATLRACHLFP